MAKRALILLEGHPRGNGLLYVQAAQRLGLHPITLSTDPAQYDYFAAEGIEAIPVDTGSIQGDAHEHEHFGLRQVHGSLVAADGRAKCTADGVGIGRTRQMPKTASGDQVVGPAAQLLANIVDQKIDAAAFADNAGQRLACHRFLCRENGRLDATHLFPPAHLRRQVVELPLKEAFASLLAFRPHSPPSSSQSVDAKGRAVGKLADSAEFDQPVEQAAQAAVAHADPFVPARRDQRVLG